MGVQSYNVTLNDLFWVVSESPAVKVSPDVLRESRSVKISCETPADVTVKHCYFYVNSEQKNTKVSPSCELELTGAEVLRWADVKSPASVDIYCYYIIHELKIDKPSSHSPAATVTVLGSLQKPIISVGDNDVQINIVCEIPLSVRADFTCSLYTEDVLLHRRVSQKRQSGDNYCMFYLSYNELFTRPVNSRELSCDYYINTEPEIRSPRSDTHTIRGLPQAKLTASASVIMETDTVQLSCENTEDLKMEMCVFNINGRESFSKQSSSCQFSLTGSQISIWSEGQSSSVRITCFYTVEKSQVLVSSPHSDPVTITIQISTGQTLTTATITMTSTGETLTAKTTSVFTPASALPETTRQSETSVPPPDQIHCEGSPAVKVSPDVLRESRSVKISCVTPADVTVKQCNFYVNSEQKNTKVSPSCELELTGAEVLRWADVKSPASVDIYCYYIIHELKIDKPSSHSPAASVTVLGSLQKPIISVDDDDVQINIVCEIPLSVRADFTCSLYTEDVLQHRRVSQKRQSGDNYCRFYLSYIELFTRPVNSRELSCDYYINTEPEIRSPRSDTHTIRVVSESPAVKVSPDVREFRSVKIICETPADVTVKQCNFYINSEQKNTKVSPSCELELTGAEVLRWADVKSPASVDIYCFYIRHEHEIDKPSSHSPAATVTVLGSLQKPIISVGDNDVQINIACEIPLSVRADFTCSLYTEDVLLHRRVSQKRQSGDNYCMFYLSYNELITRPVNSRELSCDYYINTEPEIRSPRSDTHTIRGLPQAKLTASASVIMETDTVQLSCENTENLKMEMCVFNINGRESFSKQSSSCQFSLTGSQISIWSEGQSSSVRITCFYTVEKSQVLVPSPHSDPVTTTIQISTSATTAHVTTTMKTISTSATTAHVTTTLKTCK
ncbi:uncharacterized protein LOC143711405 [Siphateles boraxobius]|uniref:uncharacterized protein LOC143711405 n=1 Tax=Siphateles boraxobius TaxID=180520 RepID=UPI00406333CC